MNRNYDDIINLQYRPSSKHPHMSLYDRAAQFAPFAALTGHNAAIKESARLTEQKLELDEDALWILSEKLSIVQARLQDKPEVQITYFKADDKKSGGAYITQSGFITKVNVYERFLVMNDGIRLNFDDIYDITGQIFDGLI